MRDRRTGIKTLYIMAGVLAALILAGFFLRHTLSAILTSLLLAYLINPFLKSLEKRGLDRITAIVLMYGVSAFILTMLTMLLLPYLNHQVDSFTASLPRYMHNMKNAQAEWKVRLAPYYSGEEGAWLINRAEESLNRLAQEISGKGYEGLKGVLFGVFNLLLAPILIFFMLLYKEHFKIVIMRLIPHSERRNLSETGRRINRTLQRFMLAMLLDCLLVGILCTVALYLLDIEFPILNGLLAGFASMVPFIGALIAVIPPALLGYVKSGDLTVIPKVMLAYFFINVIIEGNVIKPLLMKTTLKLNPLAVIFAVMALGELLGFWGIVLAIPIAAVVDICAGELRELLVNGYKRPE